MQYVLHVIICAQHYRGDRKVVFVLVMYNVLVTKILIVVEGS